MHVSLLQSLRQVQSQSRKTYHNLSRMDDPIMLRSAKHCIFVAVVSMFDDGYSNLKPKLVVAGVRFAGFGEHMEQLHHLGVYIRFFLFIVHV